MIPVQITLEGFMSYRDEATLCFEGAALWMLCGRNGAGKSTVFDAMKWALFGTHRDGTQGAENLIHHEKSALRVAFDFALGPDVFRVQRTLSRRGRPAFQVFHLEGPNAPRPGMAAPQAVPETDSKNGFNRWIEANIGLSEETFGAAVMLQQGKSEALLSADAVARHEMLSQIVDVSAFERLHTRAEEKRRDLDGQARALQTQLQGLPAVDEAQITTLIARVTTLGESLHEANLVLENTLQLQVHAAQWAELQGEATSLEAGLQRAAELLSDAPAIERDAARLEELTIVLPRLESALTQRVRLARSMEDEAAQRKLASQAERDALQAEYDQDEAARLFQKLKEQRDAASDTSRDANALLLEMAPAMHAIGDCERWHGELRVLDEALARFPADLDEQVERAVSAYEQANETKRALPGLERFDKARAGWHLAGKKARESAIEVAKLSREMKRLRAEKETLEAEANEAGIRLQAAQRAQTQAETRLGAAKEHQARFDQVAGEANCSYCGQTLTPQHREREAGRLANVLRAANKDYFQAKQQCRIEKQAHDDAMEAVGTKSEAVNDVRERGRQAQDAQKAAQIDGGNQLDAAHSALQSLPETVACRVLGDDLSALDAELDEAPLWLQSSYPGVDDWPLLRAEAANLGVQQTLLNKLHTQQSRRNDKQSERTPTARRLAELQLEYPAAEMVRLRADHAHAQQRLLQAETALEQVTAPLAQAEKAEQQAAAALIEAGKKQSEALAQAAGEALIQGEIRRVLDEMRADLPASCAGFWENEIEVASRTLQAWEEEKTGLQRAEVGRQLQELEAARRQEQTLQNRLEDVMRQVSLVPIEARRAPAALEEEVQTLRQQIESQGLARRKAEGEKSGLEQQAEQRKSVEAAAREAAEAARLHKILSDSLGRDALQRHLLQEAEAAIVESANAVLDRISGGTLHLQLQGEQAEADAPKSHSTGAARRVKALEMVAFNRLNGADGQSDRPLPVAFLSGSQRFRVAVALALGIGNYASQGARRVEAVIIDEGFGSLDKEGRHEMIDELHGLQSVLKRVILVSHQDEFADAFTNRYVVELEGGTSRVSLQE